MSKDNFDFKELSSLLEELEDEDVEGGEAEAEEDGELV